MNETHFKNGRYIFIVTTFLFFCLLLTARLFYLCLFESNFLVKQGNANSLRTIKMPASRGMLLDRNGEILAVSIPKIAVWIDPKEFLKYHTDSRFIASDLHKLSKILNSDIKKLWLLISAHKKGEFLYLSRNLNNDIEKTISKLNIRGVYTLKEFHRFYPDGKAAASLLGNTDVDDNGKDGIELKYNDYLKGLDGKETVIMDRYGHIVEKCKLINKKRNGNDLKLTIDNRIQLLAYNELQEGVEEHHAEYGIAVVADVSTGKILADADFPACDPNLKSSDYNPQCYRNRAIVDVFEPGSLIKSFSMLAAFTTGKFRPNTVIDTSPGSMHIGRQIVRDVEHDLGKITASEVLKYSSNVGISKIILNIPSYLLINTLKKLGFGQKTNIGFPGERDGFLPKNNKISQFALATMSFGYGFNTTAMQIIKGYLILANGGKNVDLSLIDDAPFATKADNSKAYKSDVLNSNKIWISNNKTGGHDYIFDRKLCESIVHMLESVTQKGGTAQAVKIDGYKIAGKTGTAGITEGKGYAKGMYNSFFVGLLPANNPKILIFIMLHKPKGLHFGGYTSGPIFARIGLQAANILGIFPQ